MMRILSLLPSLITVTLVSGGIFPVKLRPKVLQPDLQAISNYYDNIDDSLVAYIYWPESITFRVRMAEEKSLRYIIVEGTFTMKKRVSLSKTFTKKHGPESSFPTDRVHLFYKDDKFYVNANPIDLMTEISPEDVLYYVKQPDIYMTEGESYLSIRYFGEKEMKKVVKRGYEDRHFHFDLVLPTNPATFLLTMPECGPHFLEYTFNAIRGKATPTVDGNLRVLMGKNVVAQSVKNSAVANRLVFDPKKKFQLIIPEDINNEDSPPLNNIFGVRMATVGFLAEHRGLAVRMLSSSDISADSVNPDRHVVSSSEFLEKVRNVEPRYRYPNLHYNAFSYRPRSRKLQVKGHVMVKWANYKVDDRSLDPTCPFDVEFESPMPYFLFGRTENAVDKICTDDVSLWPKGGPNTNFGPNFDIGLMYGQD